MNKKKYIILVICVVAFILLALLLFRLLKPKGSQSSSVNDREKLKGVHIIGDVADRSSYTIDNTECTSSNICIDHMVFTYDGDKGTIQYTILNQSDTEKSGYVLITLEGHSFLFRYENLSEDESQDGLFGYDGFTFDFSDLEYQVYDATAEDLEVIYHNDSCTEQGDHTFVC